MTIEHIIFCIWFFAHNWAYTSPCKPQQKFAKLIKIILRPINDETDQRYKN